MLFGHTVQNFLTVHSQDAIVIEDHSTESHDAAYADRIRGEELSVCIGVNSDGARTRKILRHRSGCSLNCGEKVAGCERHCIDAETIAAGDVGHRTVDCLRSESDRRDKWYSLWRVCSLRQTREILAQNQARGTEGRNKRKILQVTEFPGNSKGDATGGLDGAIAYHDIRERKASVRQNNELSGLAVGKGPRADEFGDGRRVVHLDASCEQRSIGLHRGIQIEEGS